MTFRQIPPATDAPSGTVMLFFQAGAPIGWTQVTDHNDKAFRVVSGTGGGTGGSVAFTTVFGHTVVGSRALTEAQLASHDHLSDGRTEGIADVADNSRQYMSSGGTTDYNTGLAGSGGTHNHALDTQVNYIDIIIASKD